MERRTFLEAADKCYRPASRMMSDLVTRHAARDKPFRLTYGLSETLLDQTERDAPDLLRHWKELGGMGMVEFTGETHGHSLASLFDEQPRRVSGAGHTAERRSPGKFRAETPSQALDRIPVSVQIDVPIHSTISRADQECDTSAWLGNRLQQFCCNEIKRLEPLIRATSDRRYLGIWRKMQASDQFRCLSDKPFPDSGEDIGCGTAVDSFTRLHCALYDLKRRV